MPPWCACVFHYRAGAISGGAFEYGLLVTGPGAVNNNNFHGTVIEPPSSTGAHVYMSGPVSALNLRAIRIEGSAQPEGKPLLVGASVLTLPRRLFYLLPFPFGGFLCSGSKAIP